MVFFEKQYGALCAQHALNALLQGSYFTAVDLAEIARGLDERETQEMASQGTYTADFQRFQNEGSGNMDDSGFFSIQVIENALSVWGLSLVPWNNPGVHHIRANPAAHESFICNFDSHWLTFRKIDGQWYNLDSTLDGPQRVSSTLLEMTLVQLENEGHAIFAVMGALPNVASTPTLGSTSSWPSEVVEDDEDDQLRKAIALSMQDQGGGGASGGAKSATPPWAPALVAVDLDSAAATGLASETFADGGQGVALGSGGESAGTASAGEQGDGKVPNRDELRRLRAQRFG